MKQYIRALSAVGVFALILTQLSVAEAGWPFDRDDKIEGSGNVIEQKLDLADFDSIELRGVTDLDITVGEAFSAMLEVEDNLAEYVLIDVRRGRLIIELEDDIELDTDEGIILHLSMPELVEMEIKGVSQVNATGIDSDELSIEFSGVGGMELSGKAERLDVALTGVGQLDLRDLEAVDVEVAHSGVGKIHVYASERLDAAMSGIGKIRYSGDPDDVDRAESGLGRIVAAR